jgi:LacI family transcriptional regulator, gluconate utilization system Gnt-I transcriptional repressor
LAGDALPAVKERLARPQPTMADVALKAGVSTMTVSRALKRGASISHGTRAKIMAAVEELGYVLDQTAGTLSSKRSNFIAALIPSVNNSNFSDTVHGITKVLSEGGLQLLLGYTDYRARAEEKLVEAALQRRPEGVIVTGGQHSALTRRRLTSAGVPVIEIWDNPAQPIEHVVGFSNSAAIRALMLRLYARGYREIGFIGGSGERDARGSDRRRGYLASIEELGLPRDRVISVGRPPITMEHGGTSIRQLIARWPGVDAAVCVSDLSAFGAVMECHRQGWDVPDRIAIAGFGDFEVARCAHPRITTVSVDAFGIGRAAGRLMLEAIEASRRRVLLAPQTKILPFRVIERQSTLGASRKD